MLPEDVLLKITKNHTKNVIDCTKIIGLQPEDLTPRFLPLHTFSECSIIKGPHIIVRGCTVTDLYMFNNLIQKDGNHKFHKNKKQTVFYLNPENRKCCV